MQDLVKPAPPQLFPNMGIVQNERGEGGRIGGPRIGGATEGGSGGLANLGDVRIKEILEAASKNKKTILVVAAGLALIAYFYFKKK